MASNGATHPCPCGCGHDIANAQLACRAGWASLPGDLRSDISRAYRGRDRRAHLAAVGRAVSYLRVMRRKA